MRIYITAIVAMLTAAMFMTPVKADEFVCKPGIVDGISIIGVSKEVFVSKEITPNEKLIRLKKHLSMKDDTIDQLALVHTNLVTLFGRDIPFPIDEIDVYEAVKPNPASFSLVYYYKGCLLNFSVIPYTYEIQVFGQPS